MRVHLFSPSLELEQKSRLSRITLALKIWLWTEPVRDFCSLVAICEH